MIEVDGNGWITQRGFDDGRVERGAADGVNVLPRVAIVGRKVELARLIVDHAARHGNGVLKDFLRDAELLERMNPAGRERKIDRAAAHEISRARIGPALVKLDLVAAPAQIRREQSAREPTAD